MKANRFLSLTLRLLLLMGLLVCGPTFANIPSDLHPALDQVDHFLNDAEITAQVKSRLIDDKQIHIDDLTLSTDQGTVHLKGYIPSEKQRRYALRQVQSLPGVKDVDNQLRIQPPTNTSLKSYACDLAITGEILARLLVTPELRLGDLDISTRQREVFVTGEVANRRQQQQVEQVIQQVSGIKKIRDQLVVKSK